MSPILLIDGDQFLYRACAACEEEVRWDEENHVLYSNAKKATDVAIGGIEKVVEKFKPSQVRLAFTKTESFRKSLYEPYKGNRVAVRKPMAYVRVREALEEHYKSLDLPGLEADDILGIWATRDDKDYIIVSDDKDLKTIPCRLYRQGSLETITPEQADYNWLYQTLVGDTADNFPGCPGMGPVKAEKLLDVGSMSQFARYEDLKAARWQALVGAFEKAGKTADEALTQARLARILRATDWDTDKKEVILWTP
jgi:DNA polymerase-1